jgi:PAS domain S-box-containing protein
MRNQAKIAQLLTPAAEFTHHVMASAQVAICVLDSQGRFATLSPRGVAVTGYPLEELCGKPCTFLVIASDRARMERIVESVVTKGKTVGQVETTIVCKDGTPKVVRFDMGPLRIGSNIIGAVATGEDISVTRRAEEAMRRGAQELSLLSSRLLDLQDGERRRIARELHDVTAQNLFAIHIALSGLSDRVGPKSRSVLQECISLCEESREEIRTLSYLLHPPMLDEAGLVAAIKWYINGFSMRTGINVSFDTDQDLGRLPIDIETDLFRVVQECLANVHRHSGSRTASVELRRNEDGVVARVQDCGKGMPRHLRQRRQLSSLGVGIPGMRERLGQHKGNLEIKSGPRGTRITATVPFPL